MFALRKPSIRYASASLFRAMTTSKTPGPVEQSINTKLVAALSPTFLSIRNDSHKHAGHTGNPTGAADAETHFTVEVVSSSFEGKNLVQRHRMVYQLLGDELQAGLHALALKTKTPSEG